MLHNPQGTAHMRILLCTWEGSRRGPWNSIFISWCDHRSSMSRRLGDWHWILQAPIGFRQIIPPHMPQFYMPTIDNHQNNSKIAPISHCLVPTSTGKALALVSSYAIFSAEDTRHRDTGYPVCSTSPSLVWLCPPTGRGVIAMGRERV